MIPRRLALPGDFPLTGVSLASPRIWGWTLDSVEIMTTCRVLRCQTPGSDVVTGGHHLNQVHESYVCAEHKQQIDSGENWDVQDTHVLMGRDLPPTITGWSLTDSRGTQGFVLSLKTAETEAKPFEAFVTPEMAKLLHTLTETRRGE